MNTRTRRLLEGRIVSTAELSALTGVPMITLQKWAERGQIDYVKKGRTFLFDRRDFTGPATIRPAPGHAGRAQGKHAAHEGKKAEINPAAAGGQIA